ncbi:MAG: toprim domain-containing protein, partial [Propionicimonas sp.]|nr:toprim domain-containing protein [Propionicimonas sp.]
ARRNPEGAEDAKHGPKYLNTPETPLFHKGDQLYIPSPRPGATPVLVEGPLDAIAVTLASNGQHIGVAPLGTSFTETQAVHVAAVCREPIIATDADNAGRAAAERDYWLLAALGASPRTARLPEATDPASLLGDGNGRILADALRSSKPTWIGVLQERLDRDPDDFVGALTVIAAAPPEAWPEATTIVADRVDASATLLRVSLAPVVQAWNSNPHQVAAAQTVKRIAQWTPTGETRLRRTHVAPSPASPKDRGELHRSKAAHAVGDRGPTP